MVLPARGLFGQRPAGALYQVGLAFCHMLIEKVSPE